MDMNSLFSILPGEGGYQALQNQIGLGALPSPLIAAIIKNLKMINLQLGWGMWPHCEHFQLHQHFDHWIK